MARSKWWLGLMAGATLALGGGIAVAQDGEPGGMPEMGQAPEGSQACPMMKASETTRRAMDEGATVNVETTQDGAVIRFQAPASDPQAVEDARMAAQQIADAAQAGCPHACPGMQQHHQQQQGEQGEQGGGY